MRVDFGSTDFSLWGSVSNPGRIAEAAIDGALKPEKLLKTKISASSNGTPQTEVCATKTILPPLLKSCA
jgi:hypothetical protein